MNSMNSIKIFFVDNFFIKEENRKALMRGKSVYKDRLILSLLPIALSKLQLTQCKTEGSIIRLTLLFPKVECFFYAIIFLPNQLVRSNPADLEQ